MTDTEAADKLAQTRTDLLHFRAKFYRSLYFNVCHCAAYPWAHHRKIGRCGK